MTAQQHSHMVLVFGEGEKTPRIENYDDVTEMMRFVTLYLRKAAGTITKSPVRDTDLNATVYGSWDIRSKVYGDEHIVVCTVEAPMLEHNRIVVTKRDSNGAITQQTESAVMTSETYTVIDGHKVDFQDPRAGAADKEFDKQVKLATKGGKFPAKEKGGISDSNWGPGHTWNGMEDRETTITQDNGSVTVTKVDVLNENTSALVPQQGLEAI